MTKMICTLVFTALAVPTTFAVSPKDEIIDGMLYPEGPQIGKWVGKKYAATSEPNDLGPCPLEIVSLSRVPLYKTDETGKGVFDSKDNLLSDGWVTQRPYADGPRYFKKRLDKDGQTLLEPGGKVGEVEFYKEELMGESYYIAIKVDHMGRGRMKDISPSWPFEILPSIEKNIYSRYDKNAQGHMSSVPYFVQENLVGRQGVIKKVIDGREVSTDEGVPEKPFFEIKLNLDPKTLEPVFLDYRSGIVSGKAHNDWYFADSLRYECREFKKVIKR